MFNPFEWYWIKADKTVFSSACGAVVGEDDETFVAWKENGGVPTPYPQDAEGNESQAELAAVLSPYGVYINLDAAKVALKTQIDAAAEIERLKYITSGAGQAMTYSQKADEASRYLAATQPVAADYPLLSAEVGITAADIAGVAAIVDAAFKQWQTIGAAIEATRLGAKKTIEAATDVASVEAVVAAIAWPNH
ncbi:hypothetical protein QD357_01975 [Rhizobium sp. BR 317]|uniref:hypothetical protein n=1 Tax=Rhizobium sp. BR 317 TaxID=3040015 RepID=UPI0039BF0A19